MPCVHAHSCQVDFRELMMKKHDVIKSEPQLFGMVGEPSEPVACSDEVCNCIGMCRFAEWCITSLLVAYYCNQLLILVLITFSDNELFLYKVTHNSNQLVFAI